jgi:thiamine-phosphate pyrophosphorylase
MERDRPGVSAISAGHFACASCTRFSPNARCPAAISGRISSARLRLGDGDQRDLLRLSARSFCGERHFIVNRGQPRLCLLGHTGAIGRHMASRYHPVHAPALPRLWLMTDERMGDGLMDAIRALPPGSGIIFRHYRLPETRAKGALRTGERLARTRGHGLFWAGTVREARALKADGAHGRVRGAVSAPVHSLRERVAAERAGTRLLFVSPVFPTRSHPGARSLGRVRFGALMRARARARHRIGRHDAGTRQESFRIRNLRMGRD